VNNNPRGGPQFLERRHAAYVVHVCVCQRDGLQFKLVLFERRDHSLRLVAGV
jgi:hypothetical protein